MIKDISIAPVETKSQARQFTLLPWQIYRGDSNWVPPLITDQKKLMDAAKNPFFHHGEMQRFLAFRQGEVVGRIAAIINSRHNQIHGEQAGFFGFFESIEDSDIARALISAAEDWVRDKGMTTLRGPMNPSTNDTCGVLIDAFDKPPVVMMPYNPAYYAGLLEGGGFTKAKDLHAYWLEASFMKVDRFERIVDLIRKRRGVTIRSLNMKRFRQEVDLVKEVYNEAWEQNWGFVPMTDAEMEHLAKDLKPVVIPELAMFADIGGETVGFALALPDVNQALIKINGRLLPFGLIKLLWYVRKINQVRILITGLRQAYRQTGIDALFYYEIYKRAGEKGMPQGELSWILEDNFNMRRPLENMGAYIYKTYRIYEKAV